MNGTRGVIGIERLAAGEQPTLAHLFIDTGATSKEDSTVTVGDVAGFERPFLNLGKRLVAKSMDDRAAVAVAIQALKAIRRLSMKFICLQHAGRSRFAWRDHRCLWG